MVLVPRTSHADVPVLLEQALRDRQLPPGWRVWSEGGLVAVTGKASHEQVLFRCRRSLDPTGYRRVASGRPRPSAPDEYIGSRYTGPGWIVRAAEAMAREAFRCAGLPVPKGPLYCRK